MELGLLSGLHLVKVKQIEEIMKTLFLVLGLILFGFITALQYKHLWKDVPELFKDLKKKKDK